MLFGSAIVHYLLRQSKHKHDGTDQQIHFSFEHFFHMQAIHQEHVGLPGANRRATQHPVVSGRPSFVENVAEDADIKAVLYPKTHRLTQSLPTITLEQNESGSHRFHLLRPNSDYGPQLFNRLTNFGKGKLEWSIIRATVGVESPSGTPF